MILSSIQDGDEERVLLPEEDFMSYEYAESDNDTTVESLPYSNIPTALTTPMGAREANKWPVR